MVEVHKQRGVRGGGRRETERQTEIDKQTELQTEPDRWTDRERH